MKKYLKKYLTLLSKIFSLIASELSEDDHGLIQIAISQEKKKSNSKMKCQENEWNDDLGVCTFW